MKKQMTMGLIIGNRGFFPDHLAKKGREEMIAAVQRAGMQCVVLGPDESKYGCVETRSEAKACAALFQSHRQTIDGVIVSLPNFGDEKAVAETLRMADLNVPVLVQATPDKPDQMLIASRRDSFCGKLSVCNNLKQYRIPYSLTRLHTESPDSDSFQADLQWFAAVCRVVKGLRRVRIGSLGARPQAFNTVRYSEKILEGQGITVEPIDLSEVFGRAEHMKDHDPPVEAKLEAIREYVSVQGVPPAALLKMAKLSVVIDNWMRDTDLAAISLQCWTSMEEYFGVVPCAVMSMMSNNLLPSACEVDVCGAVSMYALALASETPSALLDWNNNYADDPDKAVCFHCSNLPKHFFETVKMGYQQILAGSLSKDRTYGALEGQVKAGAMTFARFSTDDNVGKICGYIGEGEFTKDPLATFGGAGVVRIARLEQLLRFICENGLEHHVAASFSSVADALYEAATRYLNWNVYRHN